VGDYPKIYACVVYIIGPHRMFEKRTIAIDHPGICQSVSLSVTQVRCAKTSERIDALFGVEDLGDPGNIVYPTFRCGLWQITLSTCYVIVIYTTIGIFEHKGLIVYPHKYQFQHSFRQRSKKRSTMLI